MKNFIVACLAVLMSFGFCEGASFDIAFSETIKHEGIAFTAFSYDNDGGGTKYGFTLKKFREICSGGKKYYVTNCDNDGDGKITKNDLRILTIYEVKQLYKQHYWDYLKCDQIYSQLVAAIVYDYLVNGGLSIKKLQKMVGAKIDGKIGPETIRKINQANECELSKKLMKSRGEWLFIHCKRYIPHTYKVCKGGWANRLNYYILQLNLTCKHEKN
ncbi:glycosyl hydrolase 108 family protein [Pseudarcicella hirudinis]|uniref:glycosyl hydrolase 108 family protein n=1 Tax=Pseudarcicella hirudinis TaxID=1079859 RepID=UPI0035EDF671